MSRHEDFAAPPAIRPPHIDPRWWYRATWHARQQAIDAYNRDTREHDPHPPALGIDPLTLLDPNQPLQDQLELIADLIDRRYTPATICARLSKKAGTLAGRLRRNGYKDAAAVFERLRNEQERGNCRHCGTPTSRFSDQCLPCAMVEVSARPELRETRSRNAKALGLAPGMRRTA